ncbi:MAG: DUF721 domain-containing protein [Kiritimatiellae bacterium]|nr:DUF721 domain-containing protein [Kiritimatiellia bacterium]
MDDRNLYGRAFGADKRGRHKSFSSALDAALADMVVERNAFFDTLADNWRRIFPNQPARPGRYEDGKIFLYVNNAPTLFLMRPRLPMIRRRLAELPGAPKRIELRLEAHAPCR